MYYVLTALRSTSGTGALLACLLVLVPIATWGCTYIREPNYAAHRVSGDFALALAAGRTEEAYGYLSEGARSRVTLEGFAAAFSSGGASGVAGAFRQAGVTDRSDEEIPQGIPNGVDVGVRIVMIQEGGEWKVANIMEKPPVLQR